MAYSNSQMSYLPTKEVLSHPYCTLLSYSPSSPPCCNYEGGSSFMVAYAHRAPVTEDVDSLFIAGHIQLITLQALGRLLNASFEQYDADGRPLNWSLEGAGSVGPGDVNIGHTPLQVDAINGQTWISQGGLLLERRNYYAAGCWAKASQPGATIRLQ